MSTEQIDIPAWHGTRPPPDEMMPVLRVIWSSNERVVTIHDIAGIVGRDQRRALAGQSCQGTA